jgi:hypothetical protein
MWNESKMPERWYELLRERMQVEEQRMRAVRDGVMIEHDDLEELMAQAASLDHEMLLAMRQAIAATIEANPSAAPLHARSAECSRGLKPLFPVRFRLIESSARRGAADRGQSGEAAGIARQVPRFRRVQPLPFQPNKKAPDICGKGFLK